MNFDFLFDTPSIAVPADAEPLFPNSIGPQIFATSDGTRIIKAGPTVKLSEAESMRYVAQHTSIPVPPVYEFYIRDGNGYIVMGRLAGERLTHVWPQLSADLQLAVAKQIRGFVTELQNLSGDFYGALWQQPCEDIFFHHLPYGTKSITYGPYRSRQQYNQGLIDALQNSKPPDNATDSHDDIIDKLLQLKDDSKLFSHGDLHRGNILVDRVTGEVTGVLDWEHAGFSVRGRDYFEAKSRIRDERWSTALDSIFPTVDRKDYELFLYLDQCLKRYTCI